MQAGSKRNLEELVATLFKHCYAKQINISIQKFYLSTQVTFGGVNIDASADDTLVFLPHRTKFEEVRNFKSPTNNKELQLFLWVATTFHCWNPNISKYSEKMKKLDKKVYTSRVKSNGPWTSRRSFKN